MQHKIIFSFLYRINKDKEKNKAKEKERIAEEEQQAETQRKQEAARETRSRRASIRSFLRQRKRIEASGAGRAGMAVSARGGALAGLSSQLGANLGFSTMMSGLSSQYSSLTQQAAMLQGRADAAAAYGSLGFQMAGFASQGGLSSLSGLIPQNPQPSREQQMIVQGI